MSKSAGTQTVTERLDPDRERFNQDVYNRAREVANTPYSANPNQTVAGVDPVSREGLTGMRATQGQLANLYQMGLNSNEQLAQQAQGLGGLASQFGQTAQQMQNGLAGGFDQQAQQMQGLAGQFDQRASGMDQWGQQFNPYIQAGQTGAAALGGDQAATQQLFNPFQQNVLDSVGSQYDRMRGQASTEANQMAAQAGAFGGSRHGVMQGARLGELDQGQMGTMANLQYQGFNDAMGRAGQAANLGLGAGQLDLSGRQVGQADRAQGMQARQLGQGFNQMGMDARGLGLQYDNLGLGARGMGLQAQGMGQAALGQAGQMAQAGGQVSQGIFNAGDYYRQVAQQGMTDQDNRFREQRDWNARNLGLLAGAGQGVPYGQSQSQPLSRNAATGALGGAATGFAIGGPVGAGIGGVLGLFG